MKTALVAAAMALIAAAPAFAEPLKVGDAAPDFTVTSTTGGKHTPFHLKDQLKKGPVVLYFYPAAFTKGCTIEAHLFADAVDDFKAKGAQVIGVSLDPIAKLDDFSKQECQGKFPLGADTDGKVADLYGVKTSFTPPGAVEPRVIASRTSYVIGRNGKIVLAHTDMNPNEHVKLSLAALK
jgi:peroxiredoxin